MLASGWTRVLSRPCSVLRRLEDVGQASILTTLPFQYRMHVAFKHQYVLPANYTKFTHFKVCTLEKSALYLVKHACKFKSQKCDSIRSSSYFIHTGIYSNWIMFFGLYLSVPARSVPVCTRLYRPKGPFLFRVTVSGFKMAGPAGPGLKRHSEFRLGPGGSASRRRKPQGGLDPTVTVTAARHLESRPVVPNQGISYILVCTWYVMV